MTFTNHRMHIFKTSTIATHPVFKYMNTQSPDDYWWTNNSSVIFCKHINLGMNIIYYNIYIIIYITEPCWPWTGQDGLLSGVRFKPISNPV